MKVFNEVQVVESLHLAAKREKIREGTGTLYRVPVPNGQNENIFFSELF